MPLTQASIFVLHRHRLMVLGTLRWCEHLSSPLWGLCFLLTTTAAYQLPMYATKSFVLNPCAQPLATYELSLVGTCDYKDRATQVVFGLTDQFWRINVQPAVVQGKVRDTYEYGDYLIIVTTDRQSAFDRILASVPFKGQVLNQTSAWWFNHTDDIVPNALVATPDPCVTVMKKCEVFPVEFVVRGFMTGSTDTSLWTHYRSGSREYCGNQFPDGMVKNQRLQENVITPTTKSATHDVPISPSEILEQVGPMPLNACSCSPLQVWQSQSICPSSTECRHQPGTAVMCVAHLMLLMYVFQATSVCGKHMQSAHPAVHRRSVIGCILQI